MIKQDYALDYLTAQRDIITLSGDGGKSNNPHDCHCGVASEQWVADVAGFSGLPWLVLEKTRRGDADVEVSMPDVEPWREHTPVLVDDIISTGRSMAATIEHLSHARMKAPVCVAVHGIFAGDAGEYLRRAGADRIVTSNTVEHETNEIDISAVLLEGIYNLPGAG